ncbi:hypothetical protein OCOJLMKI_4582 [Methylobacterium iners]|uniref:Uncharacterized protein n=1 Tax=Methylobacterium iners TaxID=418707 RepID=A0ABQ4S6B5_9HYPH|nr:hypothetical protein OCOJLMKI_4582 [Methylobacterium iners]
MATPSAISTRLRKVERHAAQTAPSMPWTRVITENDEDRDRQLAAMVAAGTHRPEWNVIDWRIVDPAPRDRT